MSRRSAGGTGSAVGGLDDGVPDPNEVGHTTTVTDIATVGTLVVVVVVDCGCTVVDVVGDGGLLVVTPALLPGPAPG